MSNGDDQPQGGFERFPRSSAGGGGGYLFDEPRHEVPPIRHQPPPIPPPSASVFNDPTIPVDRSVDLGVMNHSRILEHEPRVDPSDPFPYGPSSTFNPPAYGDDTAYSFGATRSELFDERPAPPFAPAGPTREAAVPPLERLLEGAYRWRSLLGLGLAGLMTVAIVIAYRGATGDEQTDIALAPADGQTGAAFGDTTAPSTVALSGSVPGGDQQVGSSVGEVTSTTLTPSGPTRTAGATVTVRPTSSTTTASSASSPTSSGSTPSSSAGSTPSSSSTPTSSGSSSTSDGATTSSNPASTGSTTSGSSSSSTSPTSGSTSTTLATKDFIEAETGPIGGALVANDHDGSTGAGFVSDIVVAGRGITVSTKPMVAGKATLSVRYAAGNTALPSPRRLTLRVNGVDVRGALTMPNTASWTDWKTVSVDIELKEGVNTITLILANGDNGFVNVDSFTIG